MKYIFYITVMWSWLLPCIVFGQLTPQYAPCAQCNGNNPTYGNPVAFITTDILRGCSGILKEGNRVYL